MNNFLEKLFGDKYDFNTPATILLIILVVNFVLTLVRDGFFASIFGITLSLLIAWLGNKSVITKK